MYVEGEFGFQVLIHEFCHAARICWLDGSSKNSASFDSSLEDDLLGEWHELRLFVQPAEL